MSYEVQGQIIKLDIKIPTTSALDILTTWDYNLGDEPFVIKAAGLVLNLDEQTEGKVVPTMGKYYHLTTKVLSHTGGNKSNAEEILKDWAVKFKGDLMMQLSGEDGEVWAVKVDVGVAKKVKLAIVEE